MLKVAARFILSLAVASVLIFGLLRAVPGDPARIALGVNATDEAVAALSAQLGTDRPLVVQYFSWIGGLLRGDFGLSLSSRQELAPILAERAQVSLALCLSAMALSLLLALPLGWWAARRAGRVDATLISVGSQIGIAIPSFLAGILLVTVFAVQLDWFPANGWGELRRLVLPVLALTAVQAAILTRYVRSAFLEIQGKDYIRTSRALASTTLGQALVRHGLRNAALPLLTVTGLQLSSLVVGAVVIERVFLLPGLGSLLLDSVAKRDLSTVQNVVLLLVVFTLSVNFLVDISYRLIDPRVKEKRG